MEKVSFLAELHDQAHLESAVVLRRHRARRPVSTERARGSHTLKNSLNFTTNGLTQMRIITICAARARSLTIEKRHARRRAQAVPP
jgi:hypothetical protein